jgi:hypothetical protein
MLASDVPVDVGTVLDPLPAVINEITCQVRETGCNVYSRD